MLEKALIVIPARMASTRFPNKPLAMIAGVAMIERVWSIAKTLPYDAVIATDDEYLKDFALGFGANVVMTSSECLTGTDRVAEAAKSFTDYSIIFSLQGDAVLTPPWIIDQVLNAMLQNPEIQVATPAVRLQGKALKDFVDLKQSGSSSGTCVVFDQQKKALYFSKTLIPFTRSQCPVVHRHIGLYGYRFDALQRLKELPQSVLEKQESLEQLRALENGMPIQVVIVDYQGRTHGSVDRPEDIAFVESIIQAEGELVCI